MGASHLVVIRFKLGYRCEQLAGTHFIWTLDREPQVFLLLAFVAFDFVAVRSDVCPPISMSDVWRGAVFGYRDRRRLRGVSVDSNSFVCFVGCFFPYLQFNGIGAQEVLKRDSGNPRS